MLPKDPNMLLSFVNMKLRDEYPSLEELAASLMADAGEIMEKLSAAGYVYDAEGNRFVQKEG
ncbi:MAG: DUF4250 domain-containing protein [Lachnospiraceae bacterium]|nr:DUF4250 domain-containing protein [Lachnospiraceae bacterium]